MAMLDEVIRMLQTMKDEGTGTEEDSRKMLTAISSGEDALRFARMFESLWEFWCTPCDEAKYLAKLAYQFVANIANDDMCAAKFGLVIPPDVLREFKAAMQAMASSRWGLDLTKNISPHASTGGMPPISTPGG